MKRRKFFDKSIKKAMLGGIAASGLFFPNVISAKKNIPGLLFLHLIRLESLEEHSQNYAKKSPEFLMEN